jgi:hypothetical protein
MLKLYKTYYRYYQNNSPQLPELNIFIDEQPISPPPSPTRSSDSSNSSGSTTERRLKFQQHLVEQYTLIENETNRDFSLS